MRVRTSARLAAAYVVALAIWGSARTVMAESSLDDKLDGAAQNAVQKPDVAEKMYGEVLSSQDASKEQRLKAADGLRSIYGTKKDYRALFKVLREEIGLMDVNEATSAQLDLMAGQLLFAGKSTKQTPELYMTAIKGLYDRGLQTEHVMALLATYYSETGNGDGMSALLKDADRLGYALPVARVPAAATALQAGDARKAYDILVLVGKSGSPVDKQLASTYYHTFMVAGSELGKSDEVLDLFMTAHRTADARNGMTGLRAMRTEFFSMDPSTEQLEKIASAFRDEIAARLVSKGSPDPLQETLVYVLKQAARFDEALYEGRIYMNTCAPENLLAAVNAIADVLKSQDMNLGRANAFLQYYRFGAAGADGKTGTVDDLADVLASVKTPDLPERNVLYESVLPKLGKDYKGLTQAANVQCFLDRPAEALKTLEEAFRQAPTEQTALQSVLDCMNTVIVRYGRDEKAASEYASYIMYGAVGADGVVGSKDDIQDPTPRVKAILSAHGLPATEPVAVQ